VGDVDWPRAVAILRDEAPTMVFALETLTSRPPRALRYLDPDSDFWKPYPNHLARDFARLVALAERGQADPYPQETVPADFSPSAGDRTPPPGELGARLVAQQRRHLEEGVRYCRDVLGLGERAG
jgi:hypothetical protein